MAGAGMAIDYEVEYNNRARVPEHPEIFARWTRDGAAYRASRASKAAPNSASNTAPRRARPSTCSRPKTATARRAARAVHPRRLVALARAVELQPDGARPERARRHRRGRRLRSLPAGLDRRHHRADAAACLYLWRKRFRQRIMVSGHSAGGHLAACMVATDWKTLDADAPADLVPAGYAISGVFDLAPLLHLAINADFKLDEAEARRVSPLYLAGAAGPRARRRGRRRSNRPSSCARARIIADGWRERGVETRYEAIPGAEPFHGLSIRLTDPNSAMTEARRANWPRRSPRARTSSARRSTTVSAAPTATTTTRMTLRGTTRARCAPSKPADDAARHQRQRLRPDSPRRWR